MHKLNYVYWLTIWNDMTMIANHIILPPKVIYISRNIWNKTPVLCILYNIKCAYYK